MRKRDPVYGARYCHCCARRRQISRYLLTLPHAGPSVVRGGPRDGGAFRGGRGYQWRRVPACLIHDRERAGTACAACVHTHTRTYAHTRTRRYVAAAAIRTTAVPRPIGTSVPVSRHRVSSGHATSSLAPRRRRILGRTKTVFLSRSLTRSRPTAQRSFFFGSRIPGAFTSLLLLRRADGHATFVYSPPRDQLFRRRTVVSSASNSSSSSRVFFDFPRNDNRPLPTPEIFVGQ